MPIEITDSITTLRFKNSVRALTFQQPDLEGAEQQHEARILFQDCPAIQSMARRAIEAAANHGIKSMRERHGNDTIEKLSLPRISNLSGFLTQKKEMEATLRARDAIMHELGAMEILPLESIEINNGYATLVFQEGQYITPPMMLAALAEVKRHEKDVPPAEMEQFRNWAYAQFRHRKPVEYDVDASGVHVQSGYSKFPGFDIEVRKSQAHKGAVVVSLTAQAGHGMSFSKKPAAVIDEYDQYSAEIAAHLKAQGIGAKPYPMLRSTPGRKDVVGYKEAGGGMVLVEDASLKDVIAPLATERKSGKSPVTGSNILPLDAAERFAEFAEPEKPARPCTASSKKSASRA